MSDRVSDTERKKVKCLLFDSWLCMLLLFSFFECEYSVDRNEETGCPCLHAAK